LLDEIAEERIFDARQLEEIYGISKHQRHTTNILECEGKCGDDAALEVGLGTECRPSRRSGSLCQLLGPFGFICENRVFVVDIVALDIADKPTQGLFPLVMSSLVAVPCCAC
jgi:hypothetical protein